MSNKKEDRIVLKKQSCLWQQGRIYSYVVPIKMIIKHNN